MLYVLREKGCQAGKKNLKKILDRAGQPMVGYSHRTKWVKTQERQRYKMSNKNPYRKESDYANGFDFIRKNQIVTRSQLVSFYEKAGKSDGAAIASATVLLSPRNKDSGRGKKGSCLGNYSAKGEVYFMEPLKKAKAGDELRFRLRWRKASLKPREYKRISTKEVKQVKTSNKKTLTKVSTSKVEAVA